MDALKERIELYWTRRAAAFAEQRSRELSSGKREKWLAELRTWLPQNGPAGSLRDNPQGKPPGSSQGKPPGSSQGEPPDSSQGEPPDSSQYNPLDILDIGAGTGFFALLLAEQGHRVTGIDLSEAMVREAEAAAKRLGVEAAFRVGDAERPDFPDSSFDAIVTRNLTWALPRLGEAYRAWYGLLRPGGVVVNFDADYCRCAAEGLDMDAPLPAQHAHQHIPPDLLAENDDITLELSAWQRPRPQWDAGLLLDAGFERISIDAGVWGRIYAEKDEFYNPVPIFTIAAYKAG